MTRFNSLLLAGLLAGLSGCASDLGGLGGTASHQCPMPEGGACQSVSDNLAQSMTAGARSAWASAEDPAASGRGDVTPRRITMAPGFGDALDGQPLVTRPRVMRILIDRWQDSDGNLMDQRRVFVQVDTGRWRLEHFDGSVRRAGADGNTLIPPPARATPGPAPAQASGATSLPLPAAHGFAPLVGEREMGRPQ